MQDRQPLRDSHGHIFGYRETNTVSGRITVRESSGRTLGYYDIHANRTVDARGHIVGSGDMTMMLFGH